MEPFCQHTPDDYMRDSCAQCLGKRVDELEYALDKCFRAAQNPDLDLLMLQAAVLFTVESARSGQKTR